MNPGIMKLQSLTYRQMIFKL